MYLYLFHLSGGLVAPPNTDTGLTFVDKGNVGPYLNTKTWYEGSANPPPTLVPRSGRHRRTRWRRPACDAAPGL